jgi:hypothetical protein
MKKEGNFLENDGSLDEDLLDFEFESLLKEGLEGESENSASGEEIIELVDVVEEGDAFLEEDAGDLTLTLDSAVGAALKEPTLADDLAFDLKEEGTEVQGLAKELAEDKAAVKRGPGLNAEFDDLTKELSTDELEDLSAMELEDEPADADPGSEISSEDLGASGPTDDEFYLDDTDLEGVLDERPQEPIEAEIDSIAEPVSLVGEKSEGIWEEGDLKAISESGAFDAPAGTEQAPEQGLQVQETDKAGAALSSPPVISLGISEERIEALIRETIEQVVEKVARETLIRVAERMIGQTIDALKQSLETSSD